MDELSGVEKALDTALSGLVGGRIYNQQAPQGAVRPFIIYAYQGGADLGAIGQDQRILVRPLYLVKVVSEGNSFAAGAAVMDAADELLYALRGTVTFNGKVYRILGMYRETPIRYVEMQSDGKRLNHVGGSYRIQSHHEP